MYFSTDPMERRVLDAAMNANNNGATENLQNLMNPKAPEDIRLAAYTLYYRFEWLHHSTGDLLQRAKDFANGYDEGIDIIGFDGSDEERRLLVMVMLTLLHERDVPRSAFEGTKLDEYLTTFIPPSEKKLWFYTIATEEDDYVESLFLATEDEVKQLYGQEIRYDGLFGRYSEVCVTVKEADFKVMSDDPVLIERMLEMFGDNALVGPNPIYAWQDMQEEEEEEEEEDEEEEGEEELAD